MCEKFNKLKNMFQSIDSIFPEICICNLEPTEVVDGYNYIRKSSNRIGGAGLISLESCTEIDVDKHGNAAELVTKGQAYPFHFVGKNISIENLAIKEIGFFIMHNAIILDYDKGPHWNESAINGFIKLTAKLMSAKSFLKFDSEMAAEDKQIFADEVKKEIDSSNG